MEKRVLYQFTVEGIGSFPIDMLRYDECFPDDQESASKIANSISHSYSVPQDGEIYLAAWHPKGWEPTKKRWESFLWKVVRIRLQ